ncbi:MAG: type II toxin-antitoxin system RelE/ParE family toxin [Bacteroidales bacterium]|nr:type II toxin-antitoxin system RelE/ParE family toxin [Bacteroidales bacterium]
MRNERTILAYKTYFMDFISTLNENEIKKIFYVIDMLKVQERISTKFVKFIRDGLYELRVSHNNNIYRVFFIFDNENIVLLFNGFQKKTMKTPKKEIDTALKLKEEYYASKK